MVTTCRACDRIRGVPVGGLDPRRYLVDAPGSPDAQRLDEGVLVIGDPDGARVGRPIASVCRHGVRAERERALAGIAGGAARALLHTCATAARAAASAGSDASGARRASLANTASRPDRHSGTTATFDRRRAS